MEKIDPQVLLGIRAQDIQTGLQDYTVSHFDTLLNVGMAARLAIHIRGREPIEYELLKDLAAILFGVHKLAFSPLIKLLQEVGFVRVVGIESTDRKVLPQVPYFDDLYSQLSEFAEAEGLNEAERVSVEILNRLARGPLSKRDLSKDLNLDKKMADLVFKTGRAGSYMDSFQRSDGDEILISPVYFAERPDELVKVVETHGVEAAHGALEAIRTHPGWPIAAMNATGRIGDIQLHPEQVQLVRALVKKGVLQPPAISTSRTGTNHFLFTPPIGNERVRVVEKEIYEKAMAVIATVRQGQHFARYPVRSPLLVLKALLRDGWLKATSEAHEQWRTVAALRICRRVPSGNWSEVHLIGTDENKKAVKLAIQLLEAGDIKEDRGLDPQARLMLEGGESYREALRGLGMIKQQLSVPDTADHVAAQLDDLLEQLQKGLN